MILYFSENGPFPIKVFQSQKAIRAGQLHPLKNQHLTSRNITTPSGAAARILLY
jgi:hypothetical protein